MNFVSLLDKQINNINKKVKIALIDGDDQRMIDAVKDLEKYPNIELTLLVEKPLKIKTNAKILNINQDSQKKEQLAQTYFEIREAKEKAKGKVNKETLDISKQLMDSRVFYAMMLLYLNEVDGVVGGLDYSTAEILRAAFKIIGSKPNIKTISSVMIMHKNNQTSFFTDISVNPKPDQNALVDIALNAANFVKSFNIEPKIAFLSFSTNYSAKTPETEMVHLATEEFNKKYDGIKAIGEVQLDAAVDLKVREAKYKLPSFNEPANVLIFPDLNAGNIGYKIAQRFGNFGAIGPIITGTNKPVNDLSRGAKVDDVVNTILITVLQTLRK